MQQYKDSLSIIAWNIGGANEINDPDFLDEILPHDIVILSETFAQNDSMHVQGFKCKNIFRKKKHKKAKRHSGGVSVLIKNEICKFITPVRVTSEHFIWIKISNEITSYDKDVYCCCAYIPPYGSPYYKSHPDVNLFDDLCQDIAHFCQLGHVMVTGDLNARVGKKPDTLTQEEVEIQVLDLPESNFIVAPPRCSKDSSTNTWGNNLINLCIACNLCLLNGRTLGDSEGRFTFFAANGHSTIDLSLVDSEMLANTLSFRVHNLTEFSPHCKIETTIKCSPYNPNAFIRPINPLVFDKFHWNPNTSRVKLMQVIDSPEFKVRADEIFSKKYELTLAGTKLFTADIEKLTTYLHEKCCDKTRVGKKKSRYSKVKRQSWFTQDCQMIRKRLRRAANFLSRNPFMPQARDEYRTVLRQYRRCIKKAKRSHRENTMNRLVNSVDKQELWSILSELRGKKAETPITLDELETHFAKILNNSPKGIPDERIKWLQTKTQEFISEPCHNETELIAGNYSADFLKKMSRSLKNGKSAFLDGATNEVLKLAMPKLASILSKFFNHIELSAEYPEQWKTSFLVPLHKKGGRGDPDNYRGLAVGSNLGKFYTKCLNEKLKTFLENRNIISPHQFGFRDNFRTTDAIFSLRSVLSHYKNANKAVYSCFVDFNKAFDSVNRVALTYKLGRVGVKGQMLKLISNMYDQSDYIIKSNGTFSFPVHSRIGVKQGCCLSPLLFNVFINDIHDIYKETCDPITMNLWKIHSLSFADDLVILSETAAGLKQSLNCLERYCEDWGLKVNISKTKALVFNRPFTKNIKNLSFSIDGGKVETVNSYVYLGIEMSNTGSFHKATDALYIKSLRALFSLYSAINIRSDTTNAKLYLKLFDSLIKPILLYGCEVWGHHISHQNNTISKFINKFYRILLGVPSHTSTIGTHVELGRFPIEVTVHTYMLKYWARLTTLPENSLAAHCYWTLKNNPSINDPWLTTVKNIISSSGQYYFWNQQNELRNANNSFLRKQLLYISENLKDQFLHQAVTKLDDSSKLVFFKDTKIHKNKYSISGYLSKIMNQKTRSLFTKLRLGVLPLEVEIGRRRGLPREERLCKLCNHNAVEDEIHFIFECPALKNQRDPHIALLMRYQPSMCHYDNRRKLSYLFFNEYVSREITDLSANLLLDLYNARESLL